MEIPAAYPAVLRRLPHGLALLAAGLGGFGLILWLAANWALFGRVGQCALLQGGLLLAAVLGGWRVVLARPLGLLMLLGTGGLLAWFGQTYQTGADPWQLFALWALLTLPLCLGVRSDVLWTPWALVASTGIALWLYAHTGHRWRLEQQDLQAYLIGWTLTLGLAALLSPPLQGRLGSGAWAFRLALTQALGLITLTALGGLFMRDTAVWYGAGLILLGLAAAWLSTPVGFEVYALSLVLLGLDTLLVAGLVRLVLEDWRGGDWIGRLLLIGLFAAALLAASVSMVLRQVRRQQIRHDGGAA